MRARLGVFDLFLLGLVAGMISAGVLLEAGNAMLPGIFQKSSSGVPLLPLVVALVGATGIVFIGLCLFTKKNRSRNFSVGGTDVD